MITSTVRYDLLKELAVATTVVLVVVLALAALLSSADVPPLTIQNWAQDDAIRLRDDRDERVGRDKHERAVRRAPQRRSRIGAAIGAAPLKYASVGNPERATALATYAASDAAAAAAMSPDATSTVAYPASRSPSAHVSLSEHRFETRTGNAGIAHVDQGLDSVAGGPYRKPVSTKRRPRSSAPRPRRSSEQRGAAEHQRRAREQLIEALQRHWLLLKYVNKTKPPPVRPLPESEEPARKPFKPLRSPNASTN